jgi:hypothetical protein
MTGDSAPRVNMIEESVHSYDQDRIYTCSILYGYIKILSFIVKSNGVSLVILAGNAFFGSLNHYIRNYGKEDRAVPTV